MIVYTLTSEIAYSPTDTEAIANSPERALQFLNDQGYATGPYTLEEHSEGRWRCIPTNGSLYDAEEGYWITAYEVQE